MLIFADLRYGFYLEDLLNFNPQNQLLGHGLRQQQ